MSVYSSCAGNVLNFIHPFDFLSALTLQYLSCRSVIGRPSAILSSLMIALQPSCVFLRTVGKGS